jgi:deoxyribodipyrimidine photo-lyase
LSDVPRLLASLKLDRSVEAVPQYFRGGTRAGQRRFRAFLRTKLANYAEGRNAPENEDVSKMAAYLHFGQISPLWMALELQEQRGARESVAAYLEELIVRRELAMNFCEFNEHYDSYKGVPEWARETLAKHARDPRAQRYTAVELEQGQTHDPYWNAAMREMRLTGYMHNHLRMYWGKKILEWSATPEHAFRTALHLNNRYFLCGRDPASYTNIAWLFGLHDRPWGERPIYGTVRCMMASGLERKCDIGAYVRRVEALAD